MNARIPKKEVFYFQHCFAYLKDVKKKKKIKLSYSMLVQKYKSYASESEKMEYQNLKVKGFIKLTYNMFRYGLHTIRNRVT